MINIGLVSGSWMVRIWPKALQQLFTCCSLIQVLMFYNRTVYRQQSKFTDNNPLRTILFLASAACSETTGCHVQVTTLGMRLHHGSTCDSHIGQYRDYTTMVTAP